MEVDRSIRVMVAEDSKSIRKMEVKALNAIGFANVVEAEDGQEAISKLEAGERPGLFISDWNMPNASGLDLLEWIRKHPELKSVPFIMATGRGDAGNAEQASAAGVSAMVVKPFTPPELGEIISKVFDTSAPTQKEPVQFQPERTDKGKLKLHIGHIQITDHIALGVLRRFIQEGKIAPKHFELETHCESSWNPVRNKLETGELGGAFVLAPIAMDLFQAGTPIQLVLFAHRNGSICVRRKPSEAEAKMSIKDFLRGKTFYIPHTLSIHHLLAHEFLTQIGLKPGMVGTEGVDVYFEVSPPVMMPEFVADPGTGGFIVAEPLGTKAISAGKAELLFLTGSMWQNHPCCVFMLRNEIIEQFPDAVAELVSLLIDCGQEVQKHPENAAQIGVDFLDPERKLGLNAAILSNVLIEKAGITTADLYPSAKMLDYMQRYMNEHMGMSLQVDMQKFVNTRFADAAYSARGIRPANESIVRIENLSAQIGHNVQKPLDTKSNLQFEGRYLFFILEGQEYGIHIMYVREIIKMRDFKVLPESPAYFKGVINLRNKVIPIIDLRIVLHLSGMERTKDTCVIVIEHRDGGKAFEVGLIVDSVSAVNDIHGADIVSKPNMFTSPEILAYARTGDSALRTLLATNFLLDTQGESFLHSVAASQPQ